MFPTILKDLIPKEYLILVCMPITAGILFFLISLSIGIPVRPVVFIFIIPAWIIFAIFVLSEIIDRTLNQRRDIFKLTWHIVEVNEFDFKTIDQWCSENLESKHKFIYKQKSGGCVYAIKKELDAMAFKLRWT